MGLDITAYERLTLLRATSDPKDEDLDAEGTVYLYPVQRFIAYTDGLAEGFYRDEGRSVGFCAGSYHGYNRWREWLAEMIGIASLDGFWSNPTPGPFTELINNADNEGFIGPKASSKLAADFAENRELAAAFTAKIGEPWFLEAYDQWAAAFALAANNGAVKLH